MSRKKLDLKIGSVEEKYANIERYRYRGIVWSGSLVCIFFLKHGPVAHLVERCIRIAKAVGSSPIGSTKDKLLIPLVFITLNLYGKHCTSLSPRCL